MSANEEKRSTTPLLTPPPIGSPTPVQDIDDIVLDEHRRSPQFVYVQEQVRKLPPPAKVVLDRFNWRQGFYRKEGKSLVTEYSIKFAVSLFMVFGPMILVRLIFGESVFGTKAETAVAAAAAPLSVAMSRFKEVLRFIFFIGVPYMSYVALQSAICFLPWAIFKIFRAKREDPPEELRSRVEELLAARIRMGYALFGLVLWLLAQVMYPAVSPESMKAAKKALKKAVKKEAEEEGKLDIMKITTEMAAYFARDMNFFFLYGSLAVAATSWILLAEKLLILMVAHRFHSHGLQTRITINKFARRVTRSLQGYFLEANPDLANRNWDMGVLIWEVMGKENISKEDFFPFMDESEATRYFSILDPDAVGTLTKDQFLAAVDGLYLEQSAIDRAFLDQTRIIDRFDSLMMAVAGIASAFLTIVILEPPVDVLISILIGVIGSLFFMFKDTLVMAFRSIVFVIFTHPFDADDAVVIDEVFYRVHEIGLWTSTFITNEGHLIYMNNLSLSMKPIVNLRRSPIMTESIAISVLPTTSRDQISKLESKLLRWLEKHKRDYVPSIFVRGVRVTDKEHMRLEMSLSHRSNFNDQVKKDFRSRKFMLYLMEAVAEVRIELSPPLISQ